MPDAFYLPEDTDRFIPTELTIGPWNAHSQHGGPPSALMGRAVQRAPGGEGKQVARITFEILRPVPLEPLTVSVEVLRPGKRVDLIEAHLSTDEHTVMTARSWRMRSTELDLGFDPGLEPMPGPNRGTARPTFSPPTEVNYLTSMEWLFVEGEFLRPGPAKGWLRMKHPLLPGEIPGPLVRTLAAADSSSGISATLDISEWIFINTDLTVSLHRLPQGEWIGLDARTIPQRTGIGLTTATIHDLEGPIGASAQTLLIDHA